MDWIDQIGAAAKAWTEAQKTLWEKSFGLLSTAPSVAPLKDQIDANWSTLARALFDSWTAGGGGATAQATAQRLFASQEAWLRSVELAAQAWKAIAAKLPTEQDWYKGLSQYLEELRRQITESPEKVFQSAQDLGELWRLYMTETQKLVQPWVASWQQAESHIGAAATGDGSALLELSRLYSDPLDRTFGRLLQSPSLGSTREINDKFAKGFAAWHELREASVEYQVILAEAGVRVLEQSLNEMRSMAERGQSIQSIRQWTLPLEKVADPILSEVFGSDKFIRVQGRLLNAAMAYWLRQREIVEQFLKVSDIPTRTEVDEIHQTLYAQRRELRALKKILAECSATLAQIARNGHESDSQTAVAQDTVVGSASPISKKAARRRKRNKLLTK
jgi:polyhydroxyalkanoate synthase subunit PhaE